MKKIKSFTLVEILVATTIFAIVAVIASASSSMIISTTNKSDDLSKSEVCVRQVYDFVRAAISSSDSNMRFYPAELAGTSRFQLKLFGDVPPENEASFPAIAYFVSSEKFRIIHKLGDSFFLSDELEFNKNLSTYYNVSSSKKIHSDDCSFFIPSPAPISGYDFVKPFTITRNQNIQMGDLTKSENRSYLIHLKDIAYRSKQGGEDVVTMSEAWESKIFSRLDLVISESLKSL
ncbi:MAG: hypothetical protein BWY43_00424 [candidate division WS2 bacterium ADurb.Bin280]|uniref:Uncharacterized protein n=1 Tax=candidate division WS2 bacterium ADurb.Bin280 TaxID=1852829 RepID=A0A1V5SDS6_9BACT|nr:MAG: hypothetical protein BWY43_00424 [candidate division WS2 bacterium ADurb.Bin280]